MKKRTAMLLILALLLTACGSTPVENSTDLMDDVPARVVCLAEHPDRATEAADFILRLFQSCLDGEKNTLVSPLSLLLALGMTANGADGETLAQMENTLGSDTENLNYWLYSLMGGQSDQLKLANAIWFRDHGLTVKDTFLETNANYYHADLYQAPMDAATANAVNAWVEEHTDGMIPGILDKLDPDTVMCLVNALAFDAKWEEPYLEHQVGESTFNAANGLPRTVEYMNAKEYAYLEDENATGFVKYYEGRQYAFAALLPNEGVSIEDYVNSLTGAHLREMLASPRSITTYATMPKFETEFSTELSDALKAMGMTDAFEPDKADFSRLGTAENNIYISQVLHKTFLSVAEEGTRAGAATAVVMADGAAMIEDYRRVTLNRPFVYMIVDCQENVPLFIGALMDTAG